MTNKDKYDIFGIDIAIPVFNKLMDEYGWDFDYDIIGPKDSTFKQMKFIFTYQCTSLLYTVNIQDYYEKDISPYDAFEADIRSKLEELNGGNGRENYRDILIKQIKSAGQQLIDRAEEMVSGKASYITGFSINIDITQQSDEPVTISYTTSTFDTNILRERENENGSDTY